MAKKSEEKAFRVLFICKNRVNSYGVLFGLVNSAKMLATELCAAGVEAKLASVVDGNGIDKEVHNYKPTHVVLNALWVTPEKTAELCKLYPKVSWTVMLHSKPVFLAVEGIASKWIAALTALQATIPNLWISANSSETVSMLTNAFKAKSFLLPNVYSKPDPNDAPKKKDWVWPWSHHEVGHNGVLNVACFGAVRPLKNQYVQAIAAIFYADKSNVKLFFHVNGDRIEQGGENIMKNLTALFVATGKHELVEHVWYHQADLVHEILPKMDASMQVSLSETFNITAADAVAAGIPSIGSPDVYWMSDEFKANPNSIEDIVSKLGEAIKDGKSGVADNQRILQKSNKRAVKTWKSALEQTTIA